MTPKSAKRFSRTNAFVCPDHVMREEERMTVKSGFAEMVTAHTREA
jgi:hypothetical protein